jgi:hypothetical protein
MNPMKKTAVSLLMLSASLPAISADADAPLVDRLIVCTAVTDTAQRLACFDREMAPLAQSRSSVASRPPTAAPTAPRPPATTPVAPSVAQSPPAASSVPAPASSFGKEQLGVNDKSPVPKNEQALHARIASLRQVNANAWAVTLDNGQVWRHEDVTLGAYLRDGEAVTITKAALGAYRLSRDAGNSKDWIRVKRIR